MFGWNNRRNQLLQEFETHIEYFFDYVDKKSPNTKVLSTLLAIN
jgi:hypothetical protein